MKLFVASGFVNVTKLPGVVRCLKMEPRMAMGLAID